MACLPRHAVVAAYPYKHGSSPGQTSRRQGPGCRVSGKAWIETPDETSESPMQYVAAIPDSGDARYKGRRPLPGSQESE